LFLKQVAQWLLFKLNVTQVCDSYIELLI
jgi:hypothetical protein